MSVLAGAIAGALGVIALDAAVQNAGQASTALGILPKMAAYLIDPTVAAIPNLSGYEVQSPPSIPLTTPSGDGGAHGDSQCPAGYTYDPKTKQCVSNLKPGSPGTKNLA